MNTLQTFTRNCRKHPQSVGQTYWQHFRFSATISLRLGYAALTALVHALIPGACQTSTSRSIDKLHQSMHHQTDRKTNN